MMLYPSRSKDVNEPALNRNGRGSGIMSRDKHKRICGFFTEEARKKMLEIAVKILEDAKGFWDSA